MLFRSPTAGHSTKAIVRQPSGFQRGAVQYLCVMCSKPFGFDVGTFKLDADMKCPACHSAQVRQSSDRTKLLVEQNLIEQRTKRITYPGRIRHWTRGKCGKLTDGLETHCVGCAMPDKMQIDRLEWKKKHGIKHSWALATPYAND